jgi:hypothetical protein
MVDREDAATLSALGLPHRPAAGVTVITNNAVCSAGISAHNALFGKNRTAYISRAAVVRVGTDRYVLWGVTSRTGAGRDLYFVFDTAWSLVTIIA